MSQKFDNDAAEPSSAYFTVMPSTQKSKDDSKALSHVVTDESGNESDFDDDENQNPSGSAAPIDVNLSQMYLDDSHVTKHFFGKDATYVNHLQIISLNFSHNQLLQFPTLICKFKNLISLDLSNNQLISISENICALTQLKSFSARNNVLEDLPKSMQFLRQLEVLNISGNYFDHIPPVIYEMRSLRVLYLGANSIEYLSPTIETLSNLEILYLGGNRLTEVPASLGRLTKLTSLVLADNQIETLPPTFAELQSLQSLTLHNNNLRALPTGIARLQNLQHLSLRNNPLVTKFVDDITLIPPTLKELAARVVKVRSSPDFYGHVLPSDLLKYLKSANQCVNPMCRGVYFEACAELVKFVDFCGKYRVPLMQYLCSPRCTQNSPACAFSDASDSSSSSDSEEEQYEASIENLIQYNLHIHEQPSTSTHEDSQTSFTASQAKMKKILLG